MKSQFPRFVASLFLLPLFTLPSFGQVGTAMPKPDAEPVTAGHTLALIGKVQVEGGADLTRDTLVVLECGSKVRASANIDRQGNFSLVLNATGGGQPGWDNSQIATHSLADCSVYAEAQGYRSSAAMLAGENESGIVQVGT